MVQYILILYFIWNPDHFIWKYNSRLEKPTPVRSFSRLCATLKDLQRALASVSQYPKEIGQKQYNFLNKVRHFFLNTFDHNAVDK